MKINLLITTLALVVLASCGDVGSLSLTTSLASSTSFSSTTSSLASSTPSSTSILLESSEISESIFLNQVAYGLDPRQTLEIAYRPNDVNPTPMVLFIHGGSWISGDKSMMRRYQQQVVDAGYGYVSMNYRFIMTGATYLDMLDDIQLVVQFLKEFSSDLNVDTTRMAMVGESAGAHLAMLYAYRNVSPIPIEFVMALVPPVDFTDPGYLSFGDPTVQLFLANGLMATSLIGPEDLVANGYPDSWVDASPIHHLSTAIPTLIGYAGLDELIPMSNMERFLDAATTINAPIEAILFPNSGHNLNGDPDKLNILLSTFFIYLNNFLPISTEAASNILDNSYPWGYINHMKCNQDLLHRMKRLQGQMKGVLSMMETQEPCQDLVVQLKAIRVNLDKTISLVTTDNLQQIMLDDPKDKDAIQQAMNLIVKSR